MLVDNFTVGAGYMNKRHARGFTTLELVVVLAVVGILVVAFGYGMVNRVHDARIQTAKIKLSYDFPLVIRTVLNTLPRPLEDQDLTDALVAKGLKPTTPYGGRWKARVRTRYRWVQVGYPLGYGRKNAEKEADAMARYLARLDHINVERLVGDSRKIVVRYEY